MMVLDFEWLDEEGDLSDAGLEWAMAIQDNIPIGTTDYDAYLENQLKEVPEEAKELVREAWIAFNWIVAQALIVPK